MHFVTDAVPAEIPATMRRLISIPGWPAWKRRLAWLNVQVNSNSMMPFFIDERFGMELAFKNARSHFQRTGRYPWPPDTADLQRLYSTAAMLIRIAPRLSERGQRSLQGMLLDALKAEYGLQPLAFEMKAAAHLMSRGFDVEFNDLENGDPTFDFLATKDGMEIEVECKHHSGDIGRQIHLKRVHQLGKHVLPIMSGVIDSSAGGKLVHVVLPGRLGGDAEQHMAVANAVSDKLQGTSSTAGDMISKVSIQEFQMEESPFWRFHPDHLTRDHIDEFLEQRFGLANKASMILCKPKSGAIVTVVESEKPDTVLDGIYQQLRKASRRQFSGGRPAILWCHLADLTGDQLKSLAQDQENINGVEAVAHKLITRRPHLHTVAFSAPGDVRTSQGIFESTLETSVQEIGPVYPIRSTKHPQADDARCLLF